jgi:PST family polysaccharide transporter
MSVAASPDTQVDLPANPAKSPKGTYGQILKSSALIGGSSMINIGFGIIRAKAMALLLGPSGVGLLGNYVAISDLTRTAAGLGINTSGVRQIAEAVGTGDTRQIARTVTALRRVALFSGALGAFLLLAMCRPVSRWTFGDETHAGAVALLALVAFFADVSAGQMALVQGMRRITDLARMSVLGALYGTVFSIPIVYFFGQQGVVPSLVCVAAMGIITSWWYARKIRVEKVAMPLREIFHEASALLKLGVVFMSSGLMTMGVAYLVRLIVTRKIGLDGAGYYQAAWNLGGLYVGFILQAMGADFYPRLTAVANDNEKCNRLVNEQAEVGLLLAGPGVLGTLTFAPLVIHVFYAANFAPAVEILRWICLGMVLRVASWPMGFILMAKGERKLFFWTELGSSLLSVALVWVGVIRFGLQGTGAAFFALYVAYCLAIYLVVRRLSGFRWSAANFRLAALFVPLAAAVFLAPYFVHPLVAMAFGLAASVLAGVYSLRVLCRLIPMARLPRFVQSVLIRFRIAPANPDFQT